MINANRKRHLCEQLHAWVMNYRSWYTVYGAEWREKWKHFSEIHLNSKQIVFVCCSLPLTTEFLTHSNKSIHTAPWRSITIPSVLQMGKWRHRAYPMSWPKSYELGMEPRQARSQASTWSTSPPYLSLSYMHMKMHTQLVLSPNILIFSRNKFWIL